MKTRGLRAGYWQDTPLDKMSAREWEALCDGCAKCCLVKLEAEDEDDPDSLQLFYTRIGCRLLDDKSCRCGQYDIRDVLVPGCVVLTPESLEKSKEWMPKTCAYRLLAEGEDLPAWHPLITGDPESVHRAGISVRNKTIPEYEVEEEDWIDHIIEGDAL